MCYLFLKPMKSNPKTLVIRFSSIGDIVLSSPMLRALRRRFPESQIDYVTRKEYAELVRSNHNLNYTYEFDASEGFDGLRRLKRKIRQERYDLIIDIHDSLRSRFLRSIRGVERIVSFDKRVVERTLLVKFKKNTYKSIVPVWKRYLEGLQELGVEGDEDGPELHIPDEVLFRVSGRVATLKLRRFENVLGLCPGARHFTKRWPSDRFAEVGTRFASERNGMVLIFGGKEDVPQGREIAGRIEERAGAGRVVSLCGELSVLETAAAMQFCDAILTNDSGLMHIASAMHRKLVALFGSTVREFGFFPYGEQSRVLERVGLECRPCSHIGRDSCPEDHFKCMMDLSVEDVYVAVTTMTSSTETQVA
jgi:lipopolysaccharide heptosyltransferase II